MAARCTSETAAAGPRPSRVGRWRALVLLAVHVLIALHVAHWMRTGRTLTPLEPSEAMELGASGVVNAGFVFFGLAILSTLVLGRWFCGWACHVVALQDGCAWLLQKAGIRPRAVDLGILGTVPWLAFAYMFLAPVADRLVRGAPLASPHLELVRADFWGTFPPWPVAVATLLVCGGAIVYLLGQKAFCTYGCPYGGIFGLVDQLSPVRIRVTDACNACGHCTTVCTSNVRVHQEVRDWKAVVDPGCMKCLDCVSICPTDALYVGVGRPALFAKRRAGSPKRRGSALAGQALLVAFVLASFAVFELSGGGTGVTWGVVLALGLPSVAVLLVFRGRSERRSEHTLGEEIALAALFLAAMFCFRGYRGWVPFLFALGISAIVAYLGLQASRVVRRRDASLLGRPLRAGGRVTVAGIALLATLAPVVAAGWDGASDRLARIGAARGELESARRGHEARERYNEGVRAFEAGDAARAIEAFRAALAVDAGLLEARENLAGMLCAVGRLDEGIREYEAAIAAREDAGTRVLLGQARAVSGDLAGARRELERAVAIEPALADAHALLAEVCAALGDAACERAHATRARELGAGAPPR